MHPTADRKAGEDLHPGVKRSIGWRWIDRFRSRDRRAGPRGLFQVGSLDEMLRKAAREEGLEVFPPLPGDATPSPEDVLVTREIVQAGRLLDVDVLDHLIIGHGVWISLRERGLGFDTR